MKKDDVEDGERPGATAFQSAELREAKRRIKTLEQEVEVLRRDRGSPFQSRKFVHALNRHNMVESMGRVGACGDNAAMEAFFALLQSNVLDRRPWPTREDLRIAIVTWIERTCHRRHRQDRLGRLTPIEFETIMTTPTTQAA